MVRTDIADSRVMITYILEEYNASIFKAEVGQAGKVIGLTDAGEKQVSEGRSR